MNQTLSPEMENLNNHSFQKQIPSALSGEGAVLSPDSSEKVSWPDQSEVGQTPPAPDKTRHTQTTPSFFPFMAASLFQDDL
jgi:hypothetical protein